MSRPSVYLCGPITGQTFAQASGTWRADVKARLEAMDIAVHTPLPHGMIKPDPNIMNAVVSSQGIVPNTALGSGKGITRLDLFYVRNCTLVLANLKGATIPSLGSCIELGWASAFGKPVVGVIEPRGDGKSNPHDHAMVYELIDFEVPDLDSALEAIQAMFSGFR